MARRRWPMRAWVGAIVGVVLGSSLGCLRDEDEFVERYAAEVCRMVHECNAELLLPGETEPLPDSPACESRVESHYDACGGRCDYRPSKARRCLRRLRRNECNDEDSSGRERGGGDETIPLVCDVVYVGCEGEGNDLCRAPVRGCSVSGEGGTTGGLALGLLVLGSLARRRRR